MMKKHVAWVCLGSLMLASLFGCRSQPMIDLTQSQYAKIAIAPFALDKGAEDMARLVTDLGTNLSLAVKDKEWIFDQSEQIAPVSDAFKQHKLTAEEVFMDPALAAKVGKSVGADLIIVGRLGKPRLETKQDPNIYYDKDTYSMTGTAARYIIQIQTALEDVQLKLIDPNTAQPLWQGDFKGYIKYFREFMQQDPAKDYARISEKQMKADLRTHLIKLLKAALFPNRFEQPPVPEILQKPSRNLIRSGGKPLLF